MPGAKKSFIGLEGFIWYIGVVEDRQDPEQLGRVRVRCFGWHTDEKSKIPTEQLPWAHPVMPVNSPNAYTPKEGDMVFGFFMDGDNAQNPAIMGVLPGKPENKPDYQKGFSDPGNNLGNRPKKPDDASEQYPKSKYIREQTTNRLSRGKPDGTIISTRKKNLKKNITCVGGVSWSEPTPAFNPTYPYNNALETESGHALEFDDSPGQERVHLAHRKGSFIEIDKDGNRVEKIVKDNYSLTMGSNFVYIAGKCSVTVDGDCNLKVGGNLNIGADGDVRIKGKNVLIESTSTTDFKIGGEARITSGGKLNLKGSTAVLQGAVIDLPAAQINMQSGSAESASGTGLTGGGTAPTETEAAAANAATQQSANTAAAAAAANTAATATAANTAAKSDGLEEVTVTGKKVGAETKSTFAKVVNGISTTVNSIVKTIGKVADSIIKDFNTGSLGASITKIAAFAENVNDNKGVILGLKSDQKNDLLSKIGKVASGAADRNIEFNLDSDITNAIQKVSKVSNIVQKVSKHLYPKSETTLEEVKVTGKRTTPQLEEVKVTGKRTTPNTSGG